MTAEGAAWIRSRPPEIRALIRRFPPRCIVRARRPLVVPAPGREGEVVSYGEGSGTIGVEDGGGFRGHCDPDWLEVVSYQDGVTPEDVARILDEDGE